MHNHSIENKAVIHSADSILKDLETRKKTIFYYLPSRLLRLYFFCGIQLRKIFNLHRKKLIKTFWGKDFYVQLFDRNTTPLLQTGCLREKEISLIKFFLKHLRSHDTFYDVGANYGFYASLAEEIVGADSVHAFEPSKNLNECLKLNLKKSQVNQAAIGHENGQIAFYDNYINGNSSVSSTLSLNESNEKYYVEMYTLDHYIKSYQPPSFIKIDVEGGEENVVRGAELLIRRYKPVIAIEFWKKRESDYTEKFFSDVGYKPFTLLKNGELQETSWDTLDQHIEGNYENFILKAYGN